MNYYRNHIRHVKGDTFSCGLIVENLGQDLDALSFTCRDSLNDNSTVLFKSKLGDGVSLVEYDAGTDVRKYAIRVAPEKTKDLQSGTYYYDEEARVNGDVFTIMKGKFIIEQDSCREED